MASCCHLLDVAPPLPAFQTTVVSRISRGPTCISFRRLGASISVSDGRHGNGWGERVGRAGAREGRNWAVRAKSKGRAKESEENRPTTSGRDAETLDLEWEKRMREETAERNRQRKREAEVEVSNENAYRRFSQELQGFPPDEVKEARKFVARLVKSGEKIEEMIMEGADNGELTSLVLLVIKNRLEVARHDDERDAIQALDLLYRRIEAEICQRSASPAMQLLNELMNLHDGNSREEWLRQSRRVMVDIFPPEDAFTILGVPGIDLKNLRGPIEMPEEEDDILLRGEFIREVDEFLQELKAQPEIRPVQGYDPSSVTLRLRQEERLRAMEQVRDLRDLAIRLQW